MEKNIWVCVCGTLNWGDNTYSHWRQHCSKGLGPLLNKKSKELDLSIHSSLPVWYFFISFFIPLLPNLHHTFMHLHCEPNSTLIPPFNWVRYFLTEMRKVTYEYPYNSFHLKLFNYLFDFSMSFVIKTQAMLFYVRVSQNLCVGQRRNELKISLK